MYEKRSNFLNMSVGANPRLCREGDLQGAIHYACAFHRNVDGDFPLDELPYPGFWEGSDASPMEKLSAYFVHCLLSSKFFFFLASLVLDDYC